MADKKTRSAEEETEPAVSLSLNPLNSLSSIGTGVAETITRIGSDVVTIWIAGVLFAVGILILSRKTVAPIVNTAVSTNKAAAGAKFAATAAKNVSTGG